MTERRTRIGEPQINWEDIARARGYHDERDMLERMYAVWTVSQMGRELDCSLYTVLYHLRKHGIVRRKRGGPYHRKIVVRPPAFRVDDWRNLNGGNT